MWDIHRTSARWLARRAARAPASHPRHRNQLSRRPTLELLEGRALLSLTTWTVNGLGDSGTGSGSSGDLRYCITQANQITGDNTIKFAPGLTGTITLNSALPDLSNTTGLMDIEGPGAPNLTVAGASWASPVGVFTIDAGVKSSISGLTITGGWADNGGGIDNEGTLTLASSKITNNRAYSNGGGIYNDGTLMITDSTIADNSAYYDLNSVPAGGGIYNNGAATIIDSTVAYNQAGSGQDMDSGLGGGIANAESMRLTNCQVTDNVATGTGGGIVSGGTLSVAGSSIAGNQVSGTPSVTGGGISIESGSLDITDSTIQGNSAIGLSGEGEYPYPGLFAGGAAFGGGVYVSGGTVSITGVTISGNSADGGPGSGTSTYILGCCYGFWQYQGYDGG